MVAVAVTGTVTLDGAPIASTPLALQYYGCELGECDNNSGWHFVAQTSTAADGTYRVMGQVPEEYCREGHRGFTVTIGLPPGSDLLRRLKWSVFFRKVDTCGENVVDFAFTCDADMPMNAPECVQTRTVG